MSTNTTGLNRPRRAAAALSTVIAAILCVQGAGCGGEASIQKPTTPVASSSAKPATAPSSTPSAAPDAFGDRPALGAPKPFEPPSPTITKAKNGMALWLMERPGIPLVSVTLVVPTGSAADPEAMPGLAHITADMLDEGAGSRSAVDVSTAISDLGATLSINVASDGTSISLTVLKKNFAKAFSILSDVVARPRFDAKEWKRVSDLWKTDLEKRADSPTLVARMITLIARFGPNDPYGHPNDGLLRGAKAIKLADAKAFYQGAFRPERATLAVAGDITRDEALKAIDEGLGSWTSKAQPAQPSGQVAAPAAPPTAWKPPRLILVDRPDATQAVIAVSREGVAASDPKAPLLDLSNTALGGAFTSRINQNLREDHNYTYGAGSAFTESRRPGLFTARAAVHTEVTGPALTEMLGELTKWAAAGPTEDELSAILALDRAELVQAYESSSGIASRLGRLAVLGLPPSFDADASRVRQKATLAALKALAPAVDPKDATIVVVGPRKDVAPQLAALHLGEPEIWDAEGNPIVPSSTPAVKPEAPPKPPAKKR